MESYQAICEVNQIKWKLDKLEMNPNRNIKSKIKSTKNLPVILASFST